MAGSGTGERNIMSDISITDHSRTRLSQRGITESMLQLAFEYGREVFTKGAICMIVGRKEVELQMERGIDLRSVEGLHVICPTRTYGLVVTAYRNRNLRGVKPNLGGGRHTPAKVLRRRRERWNRQHRDRHPASE